MQKKTKLMDLNPKKKKPTIPELEILHSKLIKILSNIKFKKGGNNL